MCLHKCWLKAPQAVVGEPEPEISVAVWDQACSCFLSGALVLWWGHALDAVMVIQILAPRHMPEHCGE